MTNAILKNVYVSPQGIQFDSVEDGSTKVYYHVDPSTFLRMMKGAVIELNNDSGKVLHTLQQVN